VLACHVFTPAPPSVNFSDEYSAAWVHRCERLVVARTSLRPCRLPELAPSYGPTSASPPERRHPLQGSPAVSDSGPRRVNCRLSHLVQHIRDVSVAPIPFDSVANGRLTPSGPSAHSGGTGSSTAPATRIHRFRNTLAGTPRRIVPALFEGATLACALTSGRRGYPMRG
jgi:hypothetical protein